MPRRNRTYRKDGHVCVVLEGIIFTLTEPAFIEFMEQALNTLQGIAASQHRPSVGGKDWLPTAANVNALPEPLRHYIHQLETIADPAGDQRALILVRDENAMLRAKLAEVLSKKSDA